MVKLWEIEGFLEERDGVLHIGAHSAPDIAEKHGTPVFVFSSKRILDNINRILKIQDVIDCDLKVCYAAKANSEHDIISVVKDSGIDIEVNSGGELQMALKAGFEGPQIIFNGTSKTVREIRAAIEAGIYAIQADSVYELGLIDQTAKDMNQRANVSLRLVPEIESRTHRGLKTALLTSKFGMMPGGAVDALKKWGADDESLNICGIHIHIGSQNSDLDSYERAFVALFENLMRIKRETGRILEHINIGGGFPVNYLRDDSHAPFINPSQRDLLSAGYEPKDAIGRAWAKVKALAEESEALELFKNIELLIEPGRSIIGDAGVCLTTVRNRKERPLRTGSKFNVEGSKSVGQSSESGTRSDSDINRGFGNDSVVNKTNLEPGTLTFEPGEVDSESGSLNHEPSKADSKSGSLHLESGRETWLLTDAGFNILLSMETYKWYYHLISAVRAAEPQRTKYKVAGPLCDGGDVYFDIEGHNRLPDHRLLPENVRPGELLALLNTGAYTVSQMFPYNGRDLPKIILV